MKFKLFTLLFFASFFAAKAQYGYHIEIDSPSSDHKWAYIAQYWDGKPYSLDSVLLSDKGRGILESKANLADGQYLLYIKPDIQLDLLLDGRKNDIKVSIAKDTKKYSISGSNDTKLLWQYILNTNDNRTEAEHIEKQINDSTISAEQKKELRVQLEALNDEFQKETDAVTRKYDGSWFSTYLRGMTPVIPPYTPPRTEEEAINNREFLKSHYFDNINLTDPRFWQTSYFPGMINNYLNTIVEPIHDSIAYAASRLVGKTKANDICFKNMLSRLTNNATKSSIMGSENIWTKLAEDYIFGKNISWIDSTQMRQLEVEYEKARFNRIGMPGHDLTLETIDGGQMNVYDINSDYTVLYFYDPTCGHCKTEIPLLHNKFYKQYKEKGVEIVAISINPDANVWKSFIKEYDLTDWVNCSDHNFKSQYWMYYDVSGTPSLFVLDKNKTIIAKKINEEMLERFFSYIIK